MFHQTILFVVFAQETACDVRRMRRDALIVIKVWEHEICDVLFKERVIYLIKHE